MNEELFDFILFIIAIIAGFVAGVKCGKDNVSDD
jgi:hypothetical protein